MDSYQKHEKNSLIPLIVIVGSTASGKTALSVELAKRLNGEIVSADSMQIYTGMQIATAKPVAAEMQGIFHHMIGFLSPGQSFSVADYVKQAGAVITDIKTRGKLPILVGGTGLYVNSLIDNITFSKEAGDADYRQILIKEAEIIGGEGLLSRLKEIDRVTAESLNAGNLRRIVRALEIYHTTGRTMSQHVADSKIKRSPYKPLMIGIGFHDRQKLYDRINSRVDAMLEAGLIKEAEQALKGTLGRTAASAIGYKELSPYFDGEIPLSEAVENLKRSTRRYAKRQMTWFRKDERINWIYADDREFDEVLDDALSIIHKSGDFLSKLDITKDTQ